jgi:hypothetical protein
MKIYSSEKEILDLVESFENASISREAWKHAGHLTVALYYVSNHDLDTATEKMRSGIFNLLRNGFKLDLTKEMPYHETLTIFWMRTVADFSALKNGASLAEKATELIGKFDKDYQLRFYSRELLFSDEARSRFVLPDIAIPGERSERSFGRVD